MNKDQINKFFLPSSLYPNIEKKWLWIRIHKNAGTSMYDGYLKDHCLNVVKNNPDGMVDQWIKEPEIKDYFVWSFVRNPYDRFISIATMFSADPNYFALVFKNLKKPISKKNITRVL